MKRATHKRGAASRGGGGRPKRARRRSGADARWAILNAAEQRLLKGGPEAIRLKEIAADVGISHPAILHHFGSREGLSEALVRHIMQRLQEELVAVVSQAPGPHKFSDRIERTAHMLELAVRTLQQRGTARLLAWLVLSGENLRPLARGMFSGFPQAVHAARVERRRVEGRSTPSLEDTLFSVTVMMITLFGETFVGRIIRVAIGLEDNSKVDRRFRRWLASAAEAYEPPVAPARVPSGGQKASRAAS